MEEYKAFLARGAELDAPTKEPVEIAMTVRDACNHFLEAREKDVEADILSSRTYLYYKRACIKLIEFYGRDRSFATLGPQDFTAYRQRILETKNAISTGNEIVRIRTILKWLKKSGYIDDYDVGPDFRKPAAKIVRRLRREKGKKLFNAQQTRGLLNESGLHLRAMILLGINCGFGNNDCNQLPLRIAQEAVETGWMEYHRPKTEVDRRCALWPKTR